MTGGKDWEKRAKQFALALEVIWTSTEEAETAALRKYAKWVLDQDADTAVGGEIEFHGRCSSKRPCKSCVCDGEALADAGPEEGFPV